MDTTKAERFSYGAYFAGQNIVYMLIQGYLLMFYVSYLKMNPALVATLFLVVRVWDAVNDPMIGILMDRFKFRNARHKNWLILTAFLVPIATLILFLVPASSVMSFKVTFMVVTYLLWDVLYTMSEVPSFAISTSISQNEGERTILLTLTQIGSVLGTAIGMGLVTLFLGGGVDEINWLLLAGVPSLLAMLVMLPQIFTLQERYHTDVVAQVSFRDMLREVLRNDQHFIIMSFYLSQAFLNAVGVFAVYVSEAYYGDARLATVTSLFTLFGVVGLGIFTPGIVNRYGKKRYLEVSMLATLLLSIPAFFIPGQMAILAMVFLGLRTMTLVVTSLLRPMFTADCVEYGQHKTGVRSDSTAFAIQTFFNKTGDALGVSLGGYILALVLFDETLPLVKQSAATINALQRWYVLLPMLMAAVMYFGPKLFYKLDEATVTKYIQSNRG